VLNIAVGGGTNLWLADELSSIDQGLWVIAGNIGDLYLSRHDPSYGQALGI